jgi:hypothetical protein
MNSEQLKKQAEQYTQDAAQKAIAFGRHIGSRALAHTSDAFSKASLGMSEAAKQLEPTSTRRSKALAIGGATLGVGAIAASLAASKFTRHPQPESPTAYPPDAADTPVSTPIRSEADILSASAPRMATEAYLDQPGQARPE